VGRAASPVERAASDPSSLLISSSPS